MTRMWLTVMLVVLMLGALACEEATDSSDGDATPDGDLDGETDGDSDDTTPDGDNDEADGDGEEEPRFPDPICETPEPLNPEGPYFTNITEQMGIGPSGLAVTGNRFAAVDIDQDGYPDLIVHAVGNHVRDEFTADPPKFYRRVLLNRPHPTLPRTRVFVDATRESNYTVTRDGGEGRSAQLAVFGDLDNDGTLDVFSGTYVDINSLDTDRGDRSEVLLNDGTGHFTLAPKSAINPADYDYWTTSGASLLDFDLDGKLDVWVGFFYERYGYLTALQNRLYRGKGDGTFWDVTFSKGLGTTSDGFGEGTNSKPSYGVTVCDVNDDGLPDLLASSYGRQYNELWLNTGEGFSDISRSSGFAADDNENFQDNEFYKCYCTVQTCDPDPGPPRVSCPVPADAYWSASDEEPWRLAGNTFCTVCGDWTGDGLPDLFTAQIVHWHIGQSSDPSELLVNVSDEKGVRFTRPGREATGLTRTHVGVDWNEGDITAVRFDFDNDGFPDLYLGNSDYPSTWGLLFRQTEDGVFENITTVSGAKHLRANGLVVADFDRDGDLDLVVGSSTARESPWKTSEVHLYRNDVGHTRNAVRLTLIGKGAKHANRSAIGAKVRVTTGARTQTEWVQSAFGHFSQQSELPLTIGLGESCVIDRLEVHWPNAARSVQTWEQVPAGYHLVIVEGEEPEFRPMSM